MNNRLNDGSDSVDHGGDPRVRSFGILLIPFLGILLIPFLGILLIPFLAVRSAVDSKVQLVQRCGIHVVFPWVWYGCSRKQDCEEDKYLGGKGKKSGIVCGHFSNDRICVGNQLISHRNRAMGT